MRAYPDERRPDNWRRRNLRHDDKLANLEVMEAEAHLDLIFLPAAEGAHKRFEAGAPLASRTAKHFENVDVIRSRFNGKRPLLNSKEPLCE